jgi:hypothetical protein
MTVAALAPSRPAPALDFRLIRRGFGYFACICAVVAPFTPEPLAFFAGALVPWICLLLVGTPTMPAAVLYLIIWQWVQTFVRVPQTWIDGDTLATGLYGSNVVRAYWYMLASLIVLALAFRAVLGGLKPPTPAQRTAHYRWQIRDLVMLYIVTMVVAFASAIAANIVPGLAQPIGAVGSVKVVALFMLFAYVLSTGQGMKILIGVVLFEVGSGFTGFFSDFRGVFIYLAIAAVAARIPWKGTVAVGAAVGSVALVSLALFWTSVKGEYRTYAAGSDESQGIVVPLSERMGYLGSRAFTPGAISLSDSAYMLLSRLAYVDIFGSVIDVQEAAPEPMPMRQWREGVGHVLTPRFLFPDKAALSDSEVYMRLARRFASEEVRMGTSISVGYMAENFADLGFPGMLVGIGALGLIIAGAIRLLMSFQLPQIVREGIIMAFAFMMSRDGVEVSLPKTLGALVMFVLVFLLLNKFVFGKVMLWLNRQSGGAMRARPS